MGIFEGLLDRMKLAKEGDSNSEILMDSTNDAQNRESWIEYAHSISTDPFDDMAVLNGPRELFFYTEKGFCHDLEKKVAELHLQVKNCYVNIGGEFNLIEMYGIGETVQNAIGEEANVIFGNITPGGEQYVQLVMELDNHSTDSNTHDVVFTAYSRKLLRDLSRIKEALESGKQLDAIQGLDELIEETQSDIAWKEPRG